MPSGYDLDSRSRTAASGEPSAAAVPVAVLIGLLCLAATVPVDRALAREAATTAGDQGYVWPLDVVPELTSTFGEFRDGHFHAGIDLSTFGRQGVPVRAVADGMVVRVRAAPNGYGRAIYLELDDGRLAVYAHLSRYMPELAEYVATQQERRRSYRVDLYPERSRFPVHRGQVIGWSGASGAGGPHLHFELREGDVAINPLVHGLPPHDVHAPTLRALVLTPLDEQARIDGACAKQRLPLHWTPDGYVLADATVPHLWGRIAVGVDCYDRAGERASRLAPLEATLELDGELLVTTRFERVSYDHAREVFAEFDLEEVLAGRKHVLSLQATPRTAGTLHGDWPPGSGRLDLQWEAYRDERGPEHQLVVRVSDAAGHVSELEVPVRVVPPIELVAASLFVPSPQSTAGGPASKPKLHVRWHDWSGPGQPTHVVIEGGELSGSFEALLEQPLPEIPPTSDRGARATFDLSELLGPRAGWPAALRVCLRSAATGLRSNRRVVALDPDGAGAIDGIGGQLEAVVDRADDTTSDDPELRLDPGARVARAELRLAALGAGGFLTAWLGDRRLPAADMRDAARFGFVLPARGEGPLRLEWQDDPFGERQQRELALAWQSVSPDTASTYLGADGRVRIEAPAGAFYEPAYLWAQVEAPADDGWIGRLPAALVPVGPLVRLEPEALPLARSLTIALAVEPGDGVLEAAADEDRSLARLGVYRLDRDGHGWEGSTVSPMGGDGATRVSARVTRLGHFFLARDEAPPRLDRVEPADGDRLTDATPLISARIDDAESGLVESELSIRIDGRPTPTEWDPDADIMRYRPRTPLAPGTHGIEFRAADRAGNYARATITIEIVP